MARNDDFNDDDDYMEDDGGGWTGLIWSSFWWPQIVTGSSQKGSFHLLLAICSGQSPNQNTAQADQKALMLLSLLIMLRMRS